MFNIVLAYRDEVLLNEINLAIIVFHMYCNVLDNIFIKIVCIASSLLNKYAF